MEMQERALSAEARLSEKEKAREETEQLFKSLREDTRSRQLEQKTLEQLARAEARIEDLEKRLLEAAAPKTDPENRTEPPYSQGLKAFQEEIQIQLRQERLSSRTRWERLSRPLQTALQKIKDLRESGRRSEGAQRAFALEMDLKLREQFENLRGDMASGLERGLEAKLSAVRESIRAEGEEQRRSLAEDMERRFRRQAAESLRNWISGEFELSMPAHLEGLEEKLKTHLERLTAAKEAQLHERIKGRLRDELSEEFKKDIRRQSQALAEGLEAKEKRLFEYAEGLYRSQSQALASVLRPEIIALAEAQLKAMQDAWPRQMQSSIQIEAREMEARLVERITRLVEERLAQAQITTFQRAEEGIRLRLEEAAAELSKESRAQHQTSAAEAQSAVLKESTRILQGKIDLFEKQLWSQMETLFESQKREVLGRLESDFAGYSTEVKMAELERAAEQDAKHAQSASAAADLNHRLSAEIKRLEESLDEAWKIGAGREIEPLKTEILRLAAQIRQAGPPLEKVKSQLEDIKTDSIEKDFKLKKLEEWLRLKRQERPAQSNDEAQKRILALEVRLKSLEKEAGEMRLFSEKISRIEDLLSGEFSQERECGSLLERLKQKRQEIGQMMAESGAEMKRLIDRSQKAGDEIAHIRAEMKCVDDQLMGVPFLKEQIKDLMDKVESVQASASQRGLAEADILPAIEIPKDIAWLQDFTRALAMDRSAAQMEEKMLLALGKQLDGAQQRLAALEKRLRDRIDALKGL